MSVYNDGKDMTLYYAPISGQIYATRTSKHLGGGRYVVTGKRWDVTASFRQVMQQVLELDKKGELPELWHNP